MILGRIQTFINGTFQSEVKGFRILGEVNQISQSGLGNHCSIPELRERNSRAKLREQIFPKPSAKTIIHSLNPKWRTPF